jgi:hypothetical protein
VAAPAHRPFPVDPADVPGDAVRYVKRTIFRHADHEPYDDDLARLIVAGVIAILAEPEADRETVEAAAAVVSEITAATGLVVAIQAVPAGG